MNNQSYDTFTDMLGVEHTIKITTPALLDVDYYYSEFEFEDLYHTLGESYDELV
jgi:hypothetical protein